MVCLGLNPWAEGWKAQTNPLSFGGIPTMATFWVVKTGQKLLVLVTLSRRHCHKVQNLDTSSQELISPQKSHLYKTTLLGFHLIGINFNSGNEYWFRQRDCQPCRWGVSCDGGPLIRYEPVEGDFRGVDVRRFIFVRGAEAAEKARGLVGH